MDERDGVRAGLKRRLYAKVIYPTRFNAAHETQLPVLGNYFFPELRRSRLLERIRPWKGLESRGGFMVESNELSRVDNAYPMKRSFRPSGAIYFSGLSELVNRSSAPAKSGGCRAVLSQLTRPPVMPPCLPRCSMLFPRITAWQLRIKNLALGGRRWNNPFRVRAPSTAAH
jgi:hypothetical protein